MITTVDMTTGLVIKVEFVGTEVQNERKESK